MKQLSKIPVLSKLVEKHLKNIKNYRKEVIINQIVRNLINLMVIDVIKNTNRNLKKIKPISPNDIYNQDHLLVDFSKDMKVMDFQIKVFLKRNMYNHKKVITNNNKGKKIIQDLFIYLIKNPKKYISNELFRNDHKERIIADFIAGMTDRYAINLHEKIK